MLDFTWDPKKSDINFRKHKVSFKEAQTCFFDPMHILIDDPDHSDKEERMILIGVSSRARLLVVVHAEIIENEIRIISARKANRRETKQYREV